MALHKHHDFVTDIFYNIKRSFKNKIDFGSCIFLLCQQRGSNVVTSKTQIHEIYWGLQP